MFGRSEDGRATRRAEQDRGLIALHVNNRLERATIRLVFANQFRKPIANRDEAGRRTQRTRVMDDSEIKRMWLAAIRVDDRDPGIAQ